MNIIKFKDKIMTDDYKMAPFYNKYLKGKYAYYILMRYVVPISDDVDYVALERAGRIPSSSRIDTFSTDCIACDFMNVYVDTNETERINDISKYILANSYVSDEDVDINELRRFRSWLAEQLLYFNAESYPLYTTEQTHVLEYYKNGMYNDVVKYLNIFGTDSGITELTSTLSCGCCNTSANIIGLNKDSLCNALEIYKKNIHDAMVLMFEDINFWSNANKEFLLLFKKYVDNIVKTELLINNKNKAIKLCSCDVTDNTKNEQILKNLSSSLQYIYNDDLIGHKNFIQTSLHDWAEYLYDYMYWEI